jgi:hypothetical protein
VVSRGVERAGGGAGGQGMGAGIIAVLYKIKRAGTGSTPFPRQ